MNYLPLSVGVHMYL